MAIPYKSNILPLVGGSEHLTDTNIAARLDASIGDVRKILTILKEQGYVSVIEQNTDGWTWELTPHGKKLADDMQSFIGIINRDRKAGDFDSKFAYHTHPPHPPSEEVIQLAVEAGAYLPQMARKIPQMASASDPATRKTREHIAFRHNQICHHLNNATASIYDILDLPISVLKNIVSTSSSYIALVSDPKQKNIEDVDRKITGTRTNIQRVLGPSIAQAGISKSMGLTAQIQRLEDRAEDITRIGESHARVAQTVENFSAELEQAKASIASSIDRRISEKAEELETLVRRSRDAATEQDTILSVLRDRMREDAILQHTASYHRSSKRFRSVGGWWLVGAALLGFFTLAATIFTAFRDFESAHDTVGFAILISVLLTFTLISSRNYRIQEHNAITNEQRKNALTTIDSFMSAAPTDEAKAEVLLQATASVFSSTPTSPGQDSGQEIPTSAVLSLTRNALKKD